MINIEIAIFFKRSGMSVVCIHFRVAISLPWISLVRCRPPTTTRRLGFWIRGGSIRKRGGKKRKRGTNSCEYMISFVTYRDVQTSKKAKAKGVAL